MWSELADRDRPLAVVDELVARKLWPDQDPIGRRVRVERLNFRAGGNTVPIEDVWLEVIGVVGAVHNESLGLELRETIYATYNLNGWGSPVAFVRTSADAGAVVPALRAAIHELDDGMAIQPFWHMDDRMAESTAEVRFTLTLLAAFGITGLVLAGVGLYGLLSHSVRQGTGEIGLRMALGAGPGSVLRLVLTQGLRLTLIGVVLGLVVAAAFSRLLENQLFGVTAHDPATFAGMAVIMTTAAAVACGLPALRALRIDPLEALRNE
jgi:putative ABC transport system permease protein